MRRTKEVEGLPILSLNQAEKVGEMAEPVLDPDSLRIIAFVVKPIEGIRPEEPLVVLTSTIRKIGKDAVTVEDRDMIVPVSEAKEVMRVAETGIAIRGLPVFTESGTRVGVVDDYSFDQNTFEAREFYVSLGWLKDLFRGPNAISVDKVRSLGRDALMVLAEEEEEEEAEEAPAAPQGLAGKLGLFKRPTAEEEEELIGPEQEAIPVPRPAPRVAPPEAAPPTPLASFSLPPDNAADAGDEDEEPGEPPHPRTAEQ